LPNHYGELTPASRRGAGSGNNFAKHNPAGPHSRESVQVRRQIGKGCGSGGRLNPRNPPNLRLVDLRRLLQNGFFDGGWLSAGQLILLRLGRLGVADASPRDQSSENRVPDVHYDFDHQAHPCPGGCEAKLVPLQGENSASVPESTRSRLAGNAPG
jgi:hypothetical protein